MAFKIETKFEDLSQAALEKVSARVIEGLEEAGQLVLPASLEAVPVDEGKLKRSIDYKVDKREMTGRLAAGGKGARHANLIEYGTYKMRPQSFLREPVERLKRAIREIFSRLLGRLN